MTWGRYIAVAMAVVLASLGFLFTPVALASGNVSISLNSSSCTLAPLGGITSCNSNGTADVNNDQGGLCLSWTYDSSHLSVSVLGSRAGVPSSTIYFPIHSGDCFSQRDLPFYFTITYIKPSCDAGTYNVVFTASQGSDQSSATFSGYVRCVLIPIPQASK